jgi:N-acetylmuramoyl-L-alanine amidase
VAGSTVIGRLSRGESAQLIDCQGSWIIVQTTGGAKGWVYGPEARVSSAKDPSISLTVSGSSWTIGKYLTVMVTHTDVNFRSGPGTSFPAIAMLSSGDVLRVLESEGEWTKAISSQGVTGWVATWLTGGVSASAGQQFSVIAESGDTRRTLMVTGPFANAIVLPSTDGKSVLVSTSSFFQASTTLPVNAYEFAGIKVFGSDVAVSFQEKSTYTVKANVPGKVVLEFAPSVTGVNVQAQENSDVLTIGTLGYALPEVTRNGDSITFFLPGASYSGAGAPSGLPAESRVIRSVSVAPRDGGTDVTLKIPGTVPYLLRKASNTIEARFALPGLSGKKIIVDPGHETEDPGATGPTGLSERNVNWEIAVRLVDLLKKAGADAQLTRPGLYVPTEAPPRWVPAPNEYSGSLAKRAAWSQGADLFISIHNDYNSDRSAAGTASYICERTLNGAESRRFAALVQKELTPVIGTQDKGVKDSDLFVVREGESPAVLVEAMFISNPREESYLRQPATWDKVAAGIARAVQKYFTPGT